MGDNNLDNVLSQYVDDTDMETLFDDDIDTFDDVSQELDFETDDDGNYIRLMDHLTDLIYVGVAKLDPNHRVQLFHESVTETVIESWMNCKQMCSKLLPKYPFVGILLDSMEPSIGGFSRKDKRDEQKGTIIECINSGLITSLVTPGLQERKYFVFLPNAGTLSAMQEFPIFENAKYLLCFINRNGDVQMTDLDISFKAIANVILKDLNISDIIISSLEGYDLNSRKPDTEVVEMPDDDLTELPDDFDELSDLDDLSNEDLMWVPDESDFID